MAHPQKDQSQPELEQDPVMQKLRSVYNEVADEPLPDRLLDLLDQLDKAERNR